MALQRADFVQSEAGRVDADGENVDDQDSAPAAGVDLTIPLDRAYALGGAEAAKRSRIFGVQRKRSTSPQVVSLTALK